MAEIKDQESFARALRALTVSQQRQVGARFVAHVLDLSNRPRFAAAQQVAASADAGAAMLADAYHWVHAIYVSTHPRSDLAELDYAKQAEHFIAEALLICLAPTYSEVREVHIAEKAAMYWPSRRESCPRKRVHPPAENELRCNRVRTTSCWRLEA